MVMGVPKIEVWGGTECTINRIGDTYHDQLERTGHRRRVSDLEEFKKLGIQALRLPVLWEHVHKSQMADWAWSDACLSSLAALHIRPIVGLLHHGSGPAHTNLLAENFATEFANYAESVARRYPWVIDYTPINEPLTTARFSALYGHWYPHKKDDASFCRALIHQCRAIVMAMQKIRTIQPKARLVFTEDLGKVFSTAKLGYQRDFENERRWLSADLLLGRVVPHHPLYPFLLNSGIQEAELEFFLEKGTGAFVYGINHYITSSRYLDHHVSRYPEKLVGGNGQDVYADTEAVRVLPHCEPAFGSLIEETWHRYQQPIALTEVHLGCRPEDQIRWFRDAWEAAAACRAQRIPVLGITAWALLGSYDWNNLSTAQSGNYESGCLDVRGLTPRRTALGRMIQGYANRGTYQHPLFSEPAWWRRSDCFFYSAEAKPYTAPKATHKPLLIAAPDGMLGDAFVRVCESRGIAYETIRRRDFDFVNVEQVRKYIHELKPWAVVNAAGFTAVDRAEAHPGQCYSQNTAVPLALANACAPEEIPFLTFSSDLVFDGSQSTPYLESATPNPLNTYGKSKLLAERDLIRYPHTLIVRTSSFFGPWDDRNFLCTALKALSSGSHYNVASNQIVSPTYLPDLVNACLDLLIDGATGVWHLTNQGQVTWEGFAQMASLTLGARSNLIRAVSNSPGLAPRPKYSVLDSQKGVRLPSLEDAVERYCREQVVIQRLAARGLQS